MTEDKTRAADRQKAYRDRMKAEGKRAITIYIPEWVYQDLKGNPQGLLDIYIKNRGQDGQLQADVTDNKLSGNLVDNLVDSKLVEIDTALTELRRRIALLQTEQDNLVMARHSLGKRYDGLHADTERNTEAINVLQTKYTELETKYNNLVDKTGVTGNGTKSKQSQTKKVTKSKFDNQWYDEYMTMNEGKTGKDRLNETAFAKLKGVDKSTISRGFARVRKERAADQ
ncbi:MAG: hypothetical protein HQK94_12460 [Nitrospirae bacterium]|nr:hypothetical protein [Nitrospirota bacterium]